LIVLEFIPKQHYAFIQYRLRFLYIKGVTMLRIATIKEAVIATGLSDSALRTGIANGTFPAFRVGTSGRGKIMIDLDELNIVIKELARNNLKAKPKEAWKSESDGSHNAVKDGNEKETILPFTKFRKVNG
jgi:hypothetical protein